jgi:Tol biopolymer transport system component
VTFGVSWSPDGTRLAFAASPPDILEGAADLYAVSPDGRMPTMISPHKEVVGDWDWRPLRTPTPR